MLLANGAPLVGRLVPYAVFDGIQLADPAQRFGG
jgi:hypothetical protein